MEHGVGFNINSMPMSQNREEQIWEGMRMVEQPFMPVPFWLFVQNITIINPPDMAKCGLQESMVQRSSYWGTLEDKGATGTSS